MDFIFLIINYNQQNQNKKFNENKIIIRLEFVKSLSKKYKPKNV